jgi:PAS domain S-box-containing protein
MYLRQSPRNIDFKIKTSLFQKLVIYAVVLVVIAVGTVTFFTIKKTVVKAKIVLIDSGLKMARYIASSAKSSFWSLNWIYVEKLLRDSVVDQEDHIIFAKIIKPDGEVYLANDQKYYGKAVSIETLPPKEMTFQDYFFEETQEKGLLVVRPINIGNETWHVQLGISLKPIDAIIQNEITRNTILAFLIIFFSALMSFYLSRLISRPITELAETACLISQGKWSKEVTIKTTDEVGLLGASFNTMIDQLNASLEAELESKRELQAKNKQLKREVIERQKAEEMLQQAYEKLEMRVAKRTKELDSANVQLRKELSVREEAENLYNTIANTSRSGVYISQDGIIVFVNSSIPIYSGYQEHELLGSGIMSFVHANDRAMVRDNAIGMLRGTVSAPYEYRMVDRYGNVRWLLETVSSISFRGKRAVLGNTMDISEIKEAEKLLEELKELESSILRSIPHAVIGVDDRTVIFANDSVEHIFGWNPKELIGKSTRFLFQNDEDFNRFGRDFYPLFLKRETVSIEPKIPFMHKDGRHLQCKITATMFGEKSGNLKCVATVEDITEQKKFQLQLLQSEKMASIGQLAAGVAHEINNPTAFVSSNLKTMSEYVKDLIRLIREYTKLKDNLNSAINTTKCPHLVSQIQTIGEMESKIDIDYILDDISLLIEESREGTGRIKKIVQDLKNFAHPGDQKMKAVNINECIESTLNVVWNEIKYKATVERDYGDLPLVECNSQQLNQVFMNILVNAAQAIEHQGIISVRTRSNGNDHVEVEITDNGTGIPHENLSRIFDPFFTTKDVGKGTGLGLHVAYDIIQKHNGRIIVNSELGKGTTFTIQFPVSGSANSSHRINESERT